MRHASAGAFALLYLGIVACSNPPTACVDFDFDGFGDACELGADCDDHNASRTNNCDRVPAPDCALDPFATGCACLNGRIVTCYPGAAETQDVGSCQAGQAICRNGTWGLCDGSVIPRGESCNGADDDCDGVIDDGVRSPCGGCDPSCRGGVWGEADALFQESEGLALTSDGWLTLARDDRTISIVWLANSADGTLSKIDAASATELARYRTGGADPSRVAVDYHGDVWVANRAFGAQGSVTKIAGDISRCVDRDGDGLQTSSGPTNLLDFGTDDCVLFNVPVGNVGDVPRAMAIDGSLGLDASSGGDVWVGLHEGMRIVKLDGLTGAQLTLVETPDFHPYGAVVDPWGILWMLERDGRLATLDTTGVAMSAEIREVPLPCYLLYSLDVDREGRLLMTGFNCDDLILYDPMRELWTPIASPASPRGVTFAPDGLAWVSHTDGRISRVSVSPFRVEQTMPLASGTTAPLESIGTAVDSLGHAWVVSETGSTEGTGVATRVDRATMTPSAQVTVGMSPHTQGDLTGSSLQGAFVPEGVSSHIFHGCDGGGTTWIALRATVHNSSASHVQVDVRHAEDEAGLSAADFLELATYPNSTPAFPLAFSQGGVLEVRLTLTTTSRVGAPRVERVGVEWSCPGPF